METQKTNKIYDTKNEFFIVDNGGFSVKIAIKDYKDTIKGLENTGMNMELIEHEHKIVKKNPNLIGSILINGNNADAGNMYRTKAHSLMKKWLCKEHEND